MCAINTITYTIEIECCHSKWFCVLVSSSSSHMLLIEWKTNIAHTLIVVINKTNAFSFESSFRFSIGGHDTFQKRFSMAIRRCLIRCLIGCLVASENAFQRLCRLDSQHPEDDGRCESDDIDIDIDTRCESSCCELNFKYKLPELNLNDYLLAALFDIVSKTPLEFGNLFSVSNRSEMHLEALGIRTHAKSICHHYISIGINVSGRFPFTIRPMRSCCCWTQTNASRFK